MFNIDWKSIIEYLDTVDLQVQQWIKTIDSPNASGAKSPGKNKDNASKNIRNSFFEPDPKRSPTTPSGRKTTTKYRECIDDSDYTTTEESSTHQPLFHACVEV